MILDEFISLQISNNGSYYKKLGYDPLLCKQGSTLKVKVSELPLNSNKRVNLKCDDCSIHFDRQFQLVSSQKIHRCFKCCRIYLGKIMDTTHIINLNKLQKGKNHHAWNPNKTEFIAYSRQVRGISEKIYLLNKNSINPLNYKRTLCGVENGYQLDHKISIKQAFLEKWPIEKCASLENLQILPWKINRTKGTKIHKEELN